MNRLLPLIEQRAAETTRCTYCPKLCRPACPVSTVTAKETLTPWGKMRSMDELRRQVDPGGEVQRAHTAWACTGCRHCFELCLLDVPVADTLWDGRADSVANGTAPAVITEFIKNFPSRLALLAQRAEQLSALHAFDGLRTQDTSTVYLPGCTAVTFEPESIHLGARAVSALSPGGCSVLANNCCGAPLFDAGDREGFVSHARNFAHSVSHFDRIVTADAGCAFTLRRSYTAVGVSLSPTVEHLAETAAKQLEKLRPVSESRAVVYHDACKLGRGLGVYEEPRAVLKALIGREPIELSSVRAHGRCSGGGGLLSITMPETARAIGHELGLEVRETGGGENTVVVSACATSRRQFRQAGVEAEDLAVYLGRSVFRSERSE